jgi:hypothetical protein
MKINNVLKYIVKINVNIFYVYNVNNKINKKIIINVYIVN